MTFDFFFKLYGWGHSTMKNIQYFIHPKKEIEIKSKYLNTPWITKGIRKSSKRKQRLYEKYLKIRSKENERTYKTCKTYSRELKEMRRKIIIEIKSNYSKLIYEIHGK